MSSFVSQSVSQSVGRSVSQSVSQARICCRNSASPKNIINGHFRKRFGLLASMNSDNYVNYPKARSGVPLLSATMIKFLPLDFLGGSQRIL